MKVLFKKPQALKDNVEMNNPTSPEAKNSSVFANYLIDEIENRFEMLRLSNRELKMVNEVKYLVQKISEIPIEDPELLKSIIKIA